MRENHTPSPNEIIKQLCLCGHFLHYRMGGKAGRRRILTTLSEHQELLQKELQDILGVQSGTLSEMIIKMEAEGLIEKTRSEKDGRHLVLRLTPEGVVQAERGKEEYDRRSQEMMSCFSPEQLQELHSLIDTMLTHWSEIEKDWEALPIQEDRKNKTKNENNE